MISGGHLLFIVQKFNRIQKKIIILYIKEFIYIFYKHRKNMRKTTKSTELFYFFSGFYIESGSTLVVFII